MYLRKKSAVSTLEYTFLIVIIIMAILATQKYIVRGFAGRWKQLGDSFGMGKQYDPQKTLECTFSADYNQWYDKHCFEQQWNATFPSNMSGCVSSCLPQNPGWGDCRSDGYQCECYLNFPFFGCILRSPECCYSQCQTRCTETVSEAAVGACTSIGDISCED